MSACPSRIIMPRIRLLENEKCVHRSTQSVLLCQHIACSNLQIQILLKKPVGGNKKDSKIILSISSIPDPCLLVASNNELLYTKSDWEDWKSCRNSLLIIWRVLGRHRDSSKTERNWLIFAPKSSPINLERSHNKRYYP